MPREGALNTGPSCFHPVPIDDMNSTKFIFLLGLLAFARISHAQWESVPNTALRDVCPANNFLGTGTYAYAFRDQCHNVYNAWNSAVIDKRGRMIIIGGGHSDYRGNEVYAFNPSTGVLSRLNDPSPWDAADSNAEVNPDGTPATRHTWGGLVYLEEVDGIFMWEGASFGAAPLRKTWMLYFNADGSINTSVGAAGWVDKLPGGINVTAGGGSSRGARCVKDVTQDEPSVLCHWGSNNSLLRYKHTSNVWEGLTSFSATIAPSAATMAIDPNRRLLIWFGNDYNTGTRAIKYVNLNPDDSWANSGDIWTPQATPTRSYTVVDISSQVTGCDAVLATDEPGVAWDPVFGRFLLYSGTGSTPYLFDIATRTCVAQPYTSGGPTGSTGLIANGILGKWSYSPAVGKFIAANNADANIYMFTLHKTPVVGLGASTYTCYDPDGDGYGKGETCTGADSDPFDNTVWNATQALAKYTTLDNYYARMGYAPVRKWFLAPSTATPPGNNATCVVNDETKPCLNYLSGSGSPAWNTQASGDALILRDGWNGRIAAPGSGSAGNPKYALAYPGETPVIDPVALASSAINLNDVGWWVFDGVDTQNTDVFAGTSSWTGSTYTSSNNVFRNGFSQDGGNVYKMFNGLSWYSFEGMVWKNGVSMSEHTIYLGSRNLPSTEMVFRNFIAYRGLNSNIHLNGRMRYLMENFLIYDNANSIQNLDLQMGTSDSVIRNGVLMDGGNSNIAIGNYFSGKCNPFYPTDGTDTYICPFHNTRNVFENLVLWQSGNAWNATGTGSGCPANIANCDAVNVSTYNWAGPIGGPYDYRGFVGGNTWRNIVFANYGNNNAQPRIRYYQNQVNSGATTDCNSLCQAGMLADKYENVILYNTDGLGNTSAAKFMRKGSALGTTEYTCSTATAPAVLAKNTNCTVANPLFVRANISEYATPGVFDFRLQSTSPAKNAGTRGAMYPQWDTVGNAYSIAAPSIGAYEYVAATAGFSIRIGGGTMRGGTIR